MELENTAQQSDTNTPEGEAAAPATLESLNDLLEDKPGDTAPEGDENGAASGDAKKEAQPKKFNDLAESLGITLDELYALEVSTTDGATVTIQELKALQGTQDDLTIRELEFEEGRTKKEGDLRQAQNELAEIVAALPDGTLNPDVLEKLRVKNAARVTVEQQRTLDSIPSWGVETARTADMTGMISHLEKFGFAKGYLATVTDHRQIVFIRESYLREQRIQKALARVRAGKPNPTTATKAAGKKAPGKTARKPNNSNPRNGLETFFNDV